MTADFIVLCARAIVVHLQLSPYGEDFDVPLARCHYIIALHAMLIAQANAQEALGECMLI